MLTFSGPYKLEETYFLAQGQSVQLGDYTLSLQKIEEGDSFTHDQPTPDLAQKARSAGSPRYIFVQASVTVGKGGKEAGALYPQVRIFAKRPDQLSLESDTIFSLGNELYATLHGLDQEDKAKLTVSVNP